MYCTPQAERLAAVQRLDEDDWVRYTLYWPLCGRMSWPDFAMLRADARARRREAESLDWARRAAKELGQRLTYSVALQTANFLDGSGQAAIPPDAALQPAEPPNAMWWDRGESELSS